MPDCVVVGAGPVGLVCALRLARAGHRVLLLEAASELDTGLRASTFHPPTLDMLAQLGVAKELVERGIVVRAWQVRHHATGSRVAFDLGTIASETGHPFRLQCEQHRLCQILLRRLRAESTAEVRFDSRVDAARQDGDAVTVRLADGEEVRGRWLIGADGASSAVRKSLGIAFEGKTWGHASLLVTTPFPFEEHLDDLAPVTYFWGEHRPFTLLRVPGRWRASLYPGAGQDLESLARDNLVQAALREIVPGVERFPIEAVHPYRVHARCAERFRQGRVLLAGDAAHVNPPSGGLGMNGGIHDAFNLTDKLDAVMTGGDEALLDRYDRQRRTLAAEGTIPQASGNRARMHLATTRDQLVELERLRRVAGDPERCRAFLLRSSMIEGLRRVEAIA